MIVSKEQERRALEKIRRIIAELGEDSYIGIAFDGCIEDAENNISNDFAESMKRRAEVAQAKNIRLLKELNDAKDEIIKYARELRDALKRIEQLEEWRPHEPSGIKQAEYDTLRRSGRLMTDEEAIDWVVAETGFQRERVSIIRSIPEEEINRNRQIRRTDRMIDRSPVYGATDWHYILFRVTANVACYYELHNDMLKPFAC